MLPLGNYTHQKEKKKVLTPDEEEQLKKGRRGKEEVDRLLSLNYSDI
jgi:hypothetical protein